MFRTRVSALAAALFLVAAPTSLTTPAFAQGETILTISGNIEGDADRDFTLADLEAMETRTIVTTTPWFDGEQTFEGISMADLMDEVGADGETLVAIALNDYASDIPIEDFERYDVMLAYKRGGEYMEISDKGPLFVMYPFDSIAELQNQMFYARAVWQVRELVVQ